MSRHNVRSAKATGQSAGGTKKTSHVGALNDLREGSFELEGQSRKKHN